MLVKPSPRASVVQLASILALAACSPPPPPATPPQAAADPKPAAPEDEPARDPLCRTLAAPIESLRLAAPSDVRAHDLVPADPAGMAAALDEAAALARNVHADDAETRTLALELATRLETTASAAHLVARWSGAPAEREALESLYSATEASYATRDSVERRCPPRHGTISPAIIQSTVRRAFGSFRLCYERGLARNPDLAGWVGTRFIIRRDGRVKVDRTGETASKLEWNRRVKGKASPPMPDPAVVACVHEVFEGLVFPPPQGGRVTVLYPIDFSPSPAPRPAPAETR